MTEPVFKLNVGMLNIAIEMSAAEAAKAEVQRQFSEQFPDVTLILENFNVDFNATNLDLTIPDYHIEEVRL